MNILITGANGLIGRHLVALLSKKNKIYAIVREKTGIQFETNNNVFIKEMDLTKFDTQELPTKIDAIYYLAQSRRFREFPEGSEDTLLVNVVAPIKLANWAIKNNVKFFLYASSGGVYTNPNQPVKEFLEINANEKLGFYLNSKLSAEMLLRNYARMFKTFVILRLFFVYGPGQNKSMLIPRLINNVKNKIEILLNGEEGISINPIYVYDAVEAIEKTLYLNGEYIFNIAGDEIVTIKGICTKIQEITGIEPIYKRVEEIQNDLIADITLMKTLLHVPKISIKEGLQRLIKEDFNDEY
ncbi:MULTISPECIES: NAD-dependent epimerase/dehydratase family protein [Thermodesulfovibrio]|uniref:NAD-dependent epimerase/dehydratase family protein n=1 Tax=Thermodesulfovibrio TaxID=28261 RepID=UPI002609D36C|nr:NAD(P)-dependent oxidoreductase [Thermodesulfovibrio sp.]